MKSIYERFFASQLGKPSGIFGRIVMRRLLNKGNRRSNQLALEHIRIGQLDRVLEIGFGGGCLIEQLLQLPEKPTVIGIDHSRTMVDAAFRQFRAYGDRVGFFVGDAASLPFASDSFSHVCSVHTIYFWENPQKVIQEIFRVLRPGGVLVLCLHSKAKLRTQSLTQYSFTLYEPEEVLKLLTDSRFENVSIASYDLDAWEDNHCVVAVKPTDGQES